MDKQKVGPLRVVLADDHVTVRHGLRLLLDAQSDLTVVGEADDGSATLQRVQELDPDVVVMDISMPGMSGLSATRVLKEARPRVAIVVLTRHADDAYLHEMLRAGAAAFVLKQSSSTELIQAIRAAAAGGQYLDANVTSRVTGGLLARDSKRAGPRLTDREAEVLRMIARGYSNKEIASQLDLSVKTIEVHKANGMRKLALRGRADIVQFAIVQGWMGEG
jgi:DNA-binding NarL/FixJ family response regulator